MQNKKPTVQRIVAVRAIFEIHVQLIKNKKWIKSTDIGFIDLLSDLWRQSVVRGGHNT